MTPIPDGAGLVVPRRRFPAPPLADSVAPVVAGSAPVDLVVDLALIGFDLVTADLVMVDLA